MKLNKEELSWILYDCGNSAYSIIITTRIFLYSIPAWQN